MDAKEKLRNRHKLGLCIQRILLENSASKAGLASSLRKLAAASGVEYAIIQKISSGKKDPQWNTIVAVIEGLNLSPTEFFSRYEQITDEAVRTAMAKPPARRKG